MSSLRMNSANRTSFEHGIDRRRTSAHYGPRPRSPASVARIGTARRRPHRPRCRCATLLASVAPDRAGDARHGGIMKRRPPFTRLAKSTAFAAGHPVSFIIALACVVVWLLTGPIFHFSDTWQLVINTGTTIVTFLMVFLIQNQQNRDSEAIQIKLDELIRAARGAQNSLLDLEELEDEELDRIHHQYELMAEHARAALRKRRRGTGAAAAREVE